MRTKRLIHGFSILTTSMTLFLLLAGALVTSTGSGLAVPDWPLSFGKFFPEMEGAVFYEHGHRMVAGVVAILSFILCAMTWRWGEDRGLKWLATGAFLAVIAQAVLGGLTVLLRLPPSVSVAHACLAQIFFSLNVIFMLLTSPKWHVRTVGNIDESATLSPIFRLALFVTAGFFVQLVLGAVMRHIGAGLIIPDFPLAYGQLIPPEFSFPVAIHFAHRTWAFVLYGLSLWLAVRIFRTQPLGRELSLMALLLIALLTVQIGLGASVIWFGRPVAVTSVHLVVGAMCLATSIAITARSGWLRRNAFGLCSSFALNWRLT